MCGRFTETVSYEKLERRFAIRRGAKKSLPPRYNIAPGQEAAVITGHGDRALHFMRWGLKLPGGHLAINARAEMLAEKPSFRRLLPNQRCLVPADGFYEWLKEGRARRPFRFVRRDREPFAFAGLWDDGLFTIVTTGANACVAPYHDRMPVILRPEHEDRWLDPGCPPDRLRGLLSPYPDDEMAAYPVSSWVNNVRNESPDCIAPLVDEEPLLPGF